MAVYTWSIDDILSRKVEAIPCVAALGMFDGVHQGHVAILDKASDMAKSLGVASAAICFDRLPLQLLNPAKAPPLLTSPPMHSRLIARHVDQVIRLKFDQNLADLPPEEFISDVLVAGLKCRGVVAGFNYSFGYGGVGRTELLQELGPASGLRVFVASPVIIAGSTVSSTRIRALIAKGEVGKAAELLGHPHYLDGVVVPGQAVGRTLGFPTANLAYKKHLAVPAEGVYATQLLRTADMEPFGFAVTAVSRRPTFGATDVSIETHVLDYDGQLYNTQVTVAFFERLRDIRKFADTTALQDQIKKDADTARGFFQQVRLQ